MRNGRSLRLERTLEGRLLETVPGRAVIEMLTGKAPSTRGGLRLEDDYYEEPDFEAYVPARWELAFTPHQASKLRREAYASADATPRDFVFAALPSVLPNEELGRGARWQIMRYDDDSSTTITWVLSARDGDTVVLDGSGRTDLASSWCAPQNTCSWWTLFEVRSTIDLASFSLDASVKRSSGTSYWSALTINSSDSIDTGTVSIKRPDQPMRFPSGDHL
jgi:hypothetical protein